MDFSVLESLEQTTERMGEEENPNSFDDLDPDLVVEEIFFRLPPESVVKSRTVSKQWRTILESKLFVERRKNIGKSRRKILASYDCECGRRPSLLPESRFEGDEEIVFMHCHAVRPSMSCDGLVCFPEPLWITIFNPSTRQLRRFPSGLNRSHKALFIEEGSVDYSAIDWSVGFGRDKVTGSYKVVRIKFPYGLSNVMQCGVLDVETGEWRKLSPPPFFVRRVSFKSACVNGSIYWFYYSPKGNTLLALDLDKEAFHDVPSFPGEWITKSWETEIVNLEDSLAIAKTEQVGLEWILEILSMDADEQGWSKTYSIRLTHGVVCKPKTFFTPLAVSKQGNLLFFDNRKRLFKYYPGEVRCLSTDIHVMSLYLENLVPLPLNSSNTYTDPAPDPYPPLDNSRPECALHPEPTWTLSKLWLWVIDNPITFSPFLLFLYLVLVGLYWCHSL